MALGSHSSSLLDQAVPRLRPKPGQGQAVGIPAPSAHRKWGPEVPGSTLLHSCPGRGRGARWDEGEGGSPLLLDAGHESPCQVQKLGNSPPLDHWPYPHRPLLSSSLPHAFTPADRVYAASGRSFIYSQAWQTRGGGTQNFKIGGGFLAFKQITGRRIV